MNKYINAILWAVGAVCVVASLALSAAYAVGMDSFVSLRIGPDGSGAALPDTLDFVNLDAKIHFQHYGDILFDEAGEIVAKSSLALSANSDGILANPGDSYLVMFPEDPLSQSGAYINLISTGLTEANEAQFNCVLLGNDATIEMLGLPPTTLHAGNSDSGMCSVELPGNSPDAINAQVRVNRDGEAFMSNRQGAELRIEADGSATMSSAAEAGGELVAQSSVTCLANGDVVVQLGPLP